MPFWRREKLHERLAREGGLSAPSPEPHDTRPRWGEVAIHGLHRQREWDAVTAVELEGPPADELQFVVLPDGTLLLDDGRIKPQDAVPLATAVEELVQPPYRAFAVRRGPSHWAVGARAIQVVALPEDVEGDALVVSVAHGDRTLTVDGSPGFGSQPELEALGAGHESFVVRAERLDETMWEVEVSPL